MLPHTLKSSCASYGISYLSTLCRELEAQARAEKTNQFIAFMLKIDAEYQIVCVALEAERNRE